MNRQITYHKDARIVKGTKPDKEAMIKCLMPVEVAWKIRFSSSKCYFLATHLIQICTLSKLQINYTESIAVKTLLQTVTFLN